MKDRVLKVFDNTQKFSSSAVHALDKVVTKTSGGVEYYIKPVRESVLKRFPIAFSLLTTLGASVTFLGLEKLVSEISFLNNNPLLMLLFGITVLAITGTLYKKLS